MFIYDAQKQKWLINGVLQTGNPYIGKAMASSWFVKIGSMMKSLLEIPIQYSTNHVKMGNTLFTTIIMAQEKSTPNMNTILCLID